MGPNSRPFPHVHSDQPLGKAMHQVASESSTRRNSPITYNTAPHSDDEAESEHDLGVDDVNRDSSRPMPQRRRVVQSCSECRRRKIKCDRKFPCAPCILRGDQDTCHEVAIIDKPKPIHSTSSGFVSTGDHIALSQRVDALQYALFKSGVVLPSDVNDYLESVRSGLRTDQLTDFRRHDSVGQGNQRLADSTHDETEDAALTLEHLAFGRSQAEGSHAIPHFGSRKRSTIACVAPGNNYHFRDVCRNAFEDQQDEGTGDSKASDLILSLVSPSDILDAFWKRTDLVTKTLARLLPTREVGEALVNNYIHKVLWLHRCIHVPTFLKQCNDLWDMPPDQAVDELTFGFIGMYLVVCCLGLQFMDPQEAAKVLSPNDIQTLPHVWYKAARMANWAADLFGIHTLESVQCLIIMTVYMNNQGRAEAAWAFLGGAIKMAQTLGLSHLGTETTRKDGKTSAMWTGRWQNLIQREVGRRVWWNLVFLDWTLGFSHNFSTSIHPDQIKTGYPANSDDEDIVDGCPLISKPKHVRTIMSYSLARIALAEINLRQIVQANNNPNPPYSFILSVDRDMQKAMIDIPPSLKTDANDPPPLEDPKGMMFHYEKMILQLAFHGRMLRLHRPFLSRGYNDETYAFSKNQCIRAGRAALRLMSADDGTASFLDKWWIALFYVSISGLVVIIDLLRTAKKNMHSRETDDKIKEIRGALDQMRRVADLSNPSRATVRIMDFLLAEVEERRNPNIRNLGKRKSEALDASANDEDHALQEAVRKLVAQATLEATDNDKGSNATPTTDKSLDAVDQSALGYMPPPLLSENNQNQNILSAASAGASLPFMPSMPMASFGNMGQFPPAQQTYFNPAIQSIFSNYLSGDPQQVEAQDRPVNNDFLLQALSFSWDAPPANTRGLMNSPATNVSTSNSNNQTPNSGNQDFGFSIENWNTSNTGWIG